MTLQEKVEAIPYWYHRIALPGGIVTPGWAPEDPAAYRFPADFTGKRVLDVGAWDGLWTFEALKRGAREVVAIDDFSDVDNFLDRARWRHWETFDLCRDALGYGADQCSRQEMSLYDVTEDRLGRFDTVLFYGTLYHCRHPLLALDRISAICNERILVETAVCDEFSPYRGGLGGGYPGRQVVCEFYPNDEYGRNPTNWWIPNMYCLKAMLEAAGFKDVVGWKINEPKSLSRCRGFARGAK